MKAKTIEAWIVLDKQGKPLKHSFGLGIHTKEITIPRAYELLGLHVVPCAITYTLSSNRKRYDSFD